jgi:hypothetical protein
MKSDFVTRERNTLRKMTLLRVICVLIKLTIRKDQRYIYVLFPTNLLVFLMPILRKDNIQSKFVS